MTSKDQSQNSKSGQFRDEFTLVKISGVSCVHKDALAANPSNGNIAFAASSKLVLQDPRSSHQEFMDNPSGRRIRSVNFSDDGKYLAYGEAGYNPCVFIHNVVERKRVSKFQMLNRSTVRAIQFHPKSIYLAVTCLNDFTIGVFNLKGRRLARVTFVVEPLGMTLPRVGSYLIVCGHRKVSLFSLTDIGSNVSQSNIVFDRRSVLLGHQSDYTFVDITSGSGQYIKKVYTVTLCGYLCDLNVGDILIDRASKIDNKCLCVKYALGYTFVGCARNTVKICSPATLSVVSIILDTDMFRDTQIQPNIFRFEADTVAIAVNNSTKIVTCVFSDHHRHSWTVKSKDNSIECVPVVPVDMDGNKVVWQPTSYEIQEKVSKVLSEVAASRPMSASPLDAHKGQGTPVAEAQKTTSSRIKPFLPTFYVNATRFSPDGKEIICGNAEGEIKIFETDTGRLSRVIEAHTAAVTHIELLYDDHFRLMASGGRDRVIFILDADKNYGLVQVLGDHSSAIVSISMAQYDEVLTLVSSAADGVILIRRAIKGKQLRFVIVGGIADIVGKPRIYAYGTDCIVTGGVNGYLNYFQTDPYVSTKPTRTIKGVSRGKNFMKAVAIDPSGTFLVASCASGTFVFNVHSGKHITTISKISGVCHISFTGDCKYLVSESNDGCRFLWRLPDKMSDVMREKAHRGFHQQEPIKFEKILSCISQESPSGYVSAFNVIRSDASEKRKKSEFSTFYDDSLDDDNDDKLSAFVSGQSSPDYYESYSTCSSFSRSCTNVTTFSHENNVFKRPDENDVCSNIFREANRLLRNTTASFIPPLDPINDLYFVTSSESSESKRTTLTKPIDDAQNEDFNTTESGITSQDLSNVQDFGIAQDQFSKSNERSFNKDSQTDSKKLLQDSENNLNSSVKEFSRSLSFTQVPPTTENPVQESHENENAMHESFAGESKANPESETVSEICDSATPQAVSLAESPELPLHGSPSSQDLCSADAEHDHGRKDKKWEKKSPVHYGKSHKAKRFLSMWKDKKSNVMVGNGKPEQLSGPGETKTIEEVSNGIQCLPKDLNKNTGNSVSLEIGPTSESVLISPGDEMNLIDDACNNYQAICSKPNTKRHVLNDSNTDDNQKHFSASNENFPKHVRNNPKRLSQMLVRPGTTLKCPSDHKNTFNNCQDLLKVATINPTEDSSPQAQSSPKVTTAPSFETGCGKNAPIQSPTLTTLTKQKKIGRDPATTRPKVKDRRHESSTTTRRARHERNDDSKSPPKATAKRDRNEIAGHKEPGKRKDSLKQSFKIYRVLYKAEVPVLVDAVSSIMKQESSSSDSSISVVSDPGDKVDLNSLDNETEELLPQGYEPCLETSNMSKNSNPWDENDVTDSINGENQEDFPTSTDALKSMDQFEKVRAEEVHSPHRDSQSSKCLKSNTFDGKPQSVENSKSLLEIEEGPKLSRMPQKTHYLRIESRPGTFQESAKGAKKTQVPVASGNRKKDFSHHNEPKAAMNQSPRIKSRCRNIHDFKICIRKAQRTPRSRVSQGYHKNIDVQESHAKPDGEQEVKRSSGIRVLKHKFKSLPRPNSHRNPNEGKARNSNGLKKSGGVGGDRSESGNETDSPAPDLCRVESETSLQRSKSIESSETLVADQRMNRAPEVAPSVSAHFETEAPPSQGQSPRVQELDESAPGKPDIDDFFDKAGAAASKSSRPRKEVIAGLGGVVDLFRNQDVYLSKLKEVRRNFEMSIETLKENKGGCTTKVSEETS